MVVSNDNEVAYSKEELAAIYELGRLYFEMGYFAPAERIFSGLVVVDGHQTASRIALGLLKIERGLYQEATVQFRSSIQANSFVLEAKMGLVVAFIGLQESSRATSLMAEIKQELQNATPEVQQLGQALYLRCQGS